MVDADRIKELVENYGLGEEVITKLCQKLLSYNCVRNEDDDIMYDCLEAIVSAKSSNIYSEEGKQVNDNDIIEKCLYRIYEYEAIPELSDKFREENGI